MECERTTKEVRNTRTMLMWKTQPAEHTNAWPDAGRYARRSEESVDQAAAVSATKPCLRSILIQRGAFLATLSAS